MISLKEATQIGLLAAVYYAAAAFGLQLAFVNESATAVWPPTGIAFAALLLGGYRLWPGVWLGAFIANITAASASPPICLAIATGNTLEALAGVWLVNRHAGGPRTFDHPRSFFKFVLLAALVSTLISSTIGVSSLVLGGRALWSQYGTIWLTWWLGDATGNLVVAPLLVLWARKPPPAWNWPKLFEGLLLFATLIVVGLVVFGELFRPLTKSNPLAFLCLPPLIWAAFRFGQRESVTAATLLSGIAIWGTLRGHGPFLQATPNESLLLLQGFMGITTVMTMALAADVLERQNATQALLRSEERFRQIAETITEVFYLYDLEEDRLVYVSPAFETLWGRTCESLYREPRSFVDAILPEFREVVTRALARQRSGDLTELEYAICRPTGTVRWVRDRSFPLRNGAGKVVRITGIAEDITERKLVQEALQRANQQVTSILNNITDGFAALDKQWRFTYINQHASRVIGRIHQSPEGLIGKRVWDQFPDLATSELAIELRDSIERQIPAAFEFFYPPLNSWFNVHAYPSPEGLAVYFNEINERKQAELARGQYAAIVESSGDAIITKNLDGIITSWNAGAEKIFGYAAHEALGRSIMMIVPKDRIAEEEQNLAKIAAGERVDHYETVRLRKDLTKIDISVAVSPIKDAHGRVIGASKIARDITAGKQSEVLIREALKEKEVMLKEINHRVKNNLQVVSSFLFLQSSQVKDPLTRQFLTETQNRVASMALIHDSLYQSQNLSRIEFGRYVRKLSSDLFHSYGANKDLIKLRVNIPETYLAVDTAIPCGLIINELLSNSLKHAFPGGRTGEIGIDLAAETDNKVTLIVRDDGVGVAQGIDIRRTTSLGMQIVNGLVKQLKGSLELNRRPGTEFKITFTQPGTR
jgi:PAS domain S-box-containing protein